MKKYLIPSIFLSLLFFSSPAIAETKTFVKEYSYQASQADSMLSSRSTALEQVKRLLLEELGTYLESTTEVKNSQLTKDEIITLTGGVIKTEIVEEKWDGKIYFFKVKMMVDPDDVYNSIDRFRRDREKGMESEEIKGEIEKLKKEKDYKEIWIRWRYMPGYAFTDSGTNKKHYQEPYWNWLAAYPSYQACIQGVKNEIKMAKEYLTKKGKGETFDFVFNDDILEVYTDKDQNKLQFRSQCFPESSSPIRLDKEESKE